MLGRDYRLSEGGSSVRYIIQRQLEALMRKPNAPFNQDQGETQGHLGLKGRLVLRDQKATGERRVNKATQGSKDRRELRGRWENKDRED